MAWRTPKLRNAYRFRSMPLRCILGWQCSISSVAFIARVRDSAATCRPGDKGCGSEGDGRCHDGQESVDRMTRYLGDVFGHAEEENAEHDADRSEEHTSELQSLMRISYAVFCLKKKKKKKHIQK